MVIDASALVSLFKGEPRAPAVRAALEGASGLLMASVTLAEIALIALKEERSAATMSGWVAELGIEIVPVDESLAVASAEARHRYPIRLGDGFVYALAKARGLSVLTLDAEFAKTDVPLVSLV